MELQQLRYVCAIAETGSFSRAAARCHVAQPSLSQQVLKLEEELGARLFDRMGRSLRITEAGQSFLPHARSILQETEAARNEVHGQQQEGRGTVVLGAIPTIAPYLVPQIAASFIRQQPHATLKVLEETTPLLVEALQNYSVDIALLSLPLKQKDLEWAALKTEPIYAAVPKKHPHARAETISLRDLRDEPFLMLRDSHCFRDVAMGICRRVRMQPQISFESGQFNSLLGMVAAGMGISVVPEMALDPNAGCAYIRVADAQAERTIVATWLRGRALTRVQQLFLRHLQESFAAHSGGSRRIRARAKRP